MAAPNIQIGAGHILTGIKAISAPNGGSSRVSNMEPLSRSVRLF